MLELHSRARKITQEKINKFALLETFAAHTAICGAVRTEWHQSIPSSSIENSAAVSETVPLVTCGQMNLPRSRRFAKKHGPSPSNHSILTRSPRRPRTPHRVYNLAADENRQEIFATVEFPPEIVVYRKDASGDEEPLRRIQGDDTGLDAPHGIAVDEKDHLLFVQHLGPSE